MDSLEMTNDEFDFDDNGLQEAFLPSSWQEIVSSDCISENDTEDSPLSHCDAVPTGGESTGIATDQRKSYWTVGLPFEDESGKLSLGVLPATVGVINDQETRQLIQSDEKDSMRSTDQTDNLDLSVYHKFKKKGAENVGAIRSRVVVVKKAKLWSGRSAKDRGCLKSSLYLVSLLSLATFSAKFCATISWQLSVYVTVGILFLMHPIGVEGGRTSVPVNTLLVVGKTARINCSTALNQPVWWARTLAGSDVQQWLYYGNDGFNSNNADSRFSIDKDETTGRYDVIIAGVQQKDAGQYVCVDESGFGARASAELVVSDPINCASRIPSDGVMGYNVFGLKQDFIEISCSLSYTGNLPPALEWSWPESEVKRDEVLVSATATSVTSTLKLVPTKEHNNVKFQCKAYTDDAVQHTVDRGLEWQSETVNVRYAEFASKEVDGCPGVEWNLVCNPQCSYHLERKDHKCRCLYTYYDTRAQHNNQVASYGVTCAKDNGSLLVVLLPVAVAAALLVATIITLVCCLKKKHAQPSVRSGPSCVILVHQEANREVLIEGSRPPVANSAGSCKISNGYKSTKPMLEEI